MILLVSDLHGRFDVVNKLIAQAVGDGADVSAVIILGDVGLFEPGLNRHFRKSGARFARPLYFIEGNHEDFTQFDTLVRRYADVMTHLPRGTIHTIANKRFLALGGTAYMDANTTPMGSVIEPRHIDACLRHPAGAVEIVLSHDAPAGLPIPIEPRFRRSDAPGFPGGASLARHFHPRYWFFGHHHCRFTFERDGTRYHGLPECTAGGLIFDPIHDKVTPVVCDT
ncbi:MAG TPA: metallophosphoesterase [Kiritimatiellia bacterium]|nr:metallophosphoesterase [Kiritimatiellia bacterium]